MRILSQLEVDKIISRGKIAPNNKITAMLDELEGKHPSVYRLIYGEPSDAIATISNDMANLYLDLSFDVVWVFCEAFGKPPEVENEEQWVARKLSFIDVELKSLTNKIPMNNKFRGKLQERFVNSSLEVKIQLELLRYLENEVDRYASFKKKRTKAIQVTNNLLFVLVRLMGDLYNTDTPKWA
ncbi:MAG: hypothetical protein J7K96_01700 [Desulfobacteraceae bacterium]|nr:hypothetical protein [Desulfobacteraceae bacterium]